MTVTAPSWIVAVAALVFGCVGFLALQLGEIVCAKIEPFDDGPAPGHPPNAALVIGSALVGAAITSRSGLGAELLIPALVVVALVASWYSDVSCGIIPEDFTLVPLGIIVAISLLGHDWARVMWLVAITLPFAVAAFFSKGLGMGWGDVKLVALGAAVLEDRSILAFAAACLAAVLLAAIRRKRTEPVAFAPYLAGAIALALAVPIFPRTGL